MGWIFPNTIKLDKSFVLANQAGKFDLPHCLDTDNPYVYGGQTQEFEWNADKAEANLRKHRIAFEAARRVFEDDFAIEWPDADLAYGEMRFVITGMVDGRLLRVVYTERNDRIRIISARKATQHEQRQYYRSQTDE
jgi:uncharacterized protein